MHALRAQLSWTHLREIIALDDPLQRRFLGLPADHSESELEAAILRELESFLLEMGQGFSFIAARSG